MAIMSIVRRMFFVAAQNNFTLRMTHKSGVDNSLAGALSRFDNSRFFTLHLKAAPVGVVASWTLDFLEEVMSQPGHCSSSTLEPGNSLDSDWRLLLEEAMGMGSSDFVAFA